MKNKNYKKRIKSDKPNLFFFGDVTGNPHICFFWPNAIYTKSSENVYFNIDANILHGRQGQQLFYYTDAFSFSVVH